MEDAGTPSPPPALRGNLHGAWTYTSSWTDSCEGSAGEKTRFLRWILWLPSGVGVRPEPDIEARTYMQIINAQLKHLHIIFHQLLRSEENPIGAGALLLLVSICTCLHHESTCGVCGELMREARLYDDFTRFHKLFILSQVDHQFCNRFLPAPTQKRLSPSHTRRGPVGKKLHVAILACLLQKKFIVNNQLVTFCNACQAWLESFGCHSCHRGIEG